MSVLRFALVVSCMVAPAVALRAAADGAADADGPAARVLCFGDSITAGSALPKDERPFVWPALVEKASDRTLRTLNEGKGGRPTASVGEFEQAVAKHAAAGTLDVVVIALGTNDSRDTSDACVPNASSNLRKMVLHARQAIAPDVKVLLVGPPNINRDALGLTKPIGEQRDRKLRELDHAFKSLAAEMKCDFVSLYGVVPAACLARDGVHPDKAGNEAIAAVMLKKLRQLRPAAAVPRP